MSGQRRRLYRAGDNYLWRLGSGRYEWFERHSAIAQNRRFNQLLDSVHRSCEKMQMIMAVAIGLFVFVAVRVLA